MPLSLKDFEYDLPEELIAQSPPEPRGASRLLQMTAEGHRDLLFRDLPDHLRAGDLLVFNDTRVIKARLRGVKESGGRVEVLIEVREDRTEREPSTHGEQDPERQEAIKGGETSGDVVLGAVGCDAHDGADCTNASTVVDALVGGVTSRRGA